jgi:hypothetical protein
VVVALVALRLRAVSEGSPRAAHDVITRADGAALAALPTVSRAIEVVARLFPDSEPALNTLRDVTASAST